MHSLTPETVLRFRCGRNHITAPSKGIVESVRDVCGVQSQVLKAAVMSVLVRTEDVTIDDIERALWEDRTLVKTWCMRGTLHLIPSADLPLYTKTFGDKLSYNNRKYLVKEGLPNRRIDSMLKEVMDVLGSEPLTKEEIAREVSARFGRTRGWIGHPWGVFLRLGCYNGSICFGPPRGANVTFVRTDEWLPRTRDTVEDHLKELLIRYMRAFGPATPHDFAYWSGLKVSTAKGLMDDIRGRLAQVKVGERIMWILEDDLEYLTSPKTDFSSLLPYFDTYLLAHKDKSLIIDHEHYKKVYRQAGWISPTIIRNGRVAGTWSYKESADILELTMEPFEKEDMDGKIAHAAERLARGLGKRLITLND